MGVTTTGDPAASVTEEEEEEEKAFFTVAEVDSIVGSWPKHDEKPL